MNGPKIGSESFFGLCNFQLKDMVMCGEEWRIEEDNKYKTKGKRNFPITTCPNQLMSGKLNVSYLVSKFSITDSDEGL
jgi:hypothetical protein